MNTLFHCSPERASEAAIDLAARRKAFIVNAGILARQNGAELIGALSAADARTRATAATLIETLAAGPPWPPTLRRDIATMIRVLTRLMKGVRLGADDAKILGWHLARLRELSAQLAQIDATEALVAMLRPSRSLQAFRRGEGLRPRKHIRR